MGKSIVKKRLKALELFTEHGEYLTAEELIKLNDYMQARLIGRWPSSSVVVGAKFHLRIAIQRFDKIMECNDG